jgi:FMN reductase
MGGAIRPASTSEQALRLFLKGLAERGAETSLFAGEALNFPIYDPVTPVSTPEISAFVETIRRCDALVIATPVYHGAVTGLIKNAIDHLTALMTDTRPYLAGRPVCCIAAGGGLQGAVTALNGLRDIVHALRGWPTPMQIPVNSSAKPFDADGSCNDPKLSKMILAAQEDLWSFTRTIVPAA